MRILFAHNVSAALIVLYYLLQRSKEGWSHGCFYIPVYQADKLNTKFTKAPICMLLSTRTCYEKFLACRWSSEALITLPPLFSFFFLNHCNRTRMRSSNLLTISGQLGYFHTALVHVPCTCEKRHSTQKTELGVRFWCSFYLFQWGVAFLLHFTAPNIQLKYRKQDFTKRSWSATDQCEEFHRISWSCLFLLPFF